MQIEIGMQVWVRIGARRQLGTVMAFPEPKRRNRTVRVRYYTGDERCVRPDQLEPQIPELLGRAWMEATHA